MFWVKYLYFWHFWEVLSNLWFDRTSVLISVWQRGSVKQRAIYFLSNTWFDRKSSITQNSNFILVIHRNHIGNSENSHELTSLTCDRWRPNTIVSWRNRKCKSDQEYLCNWYSTIYVIVNHSIIVIPKKESLYTKGSAIKKARESYWVKGKD